VFYPIVIAFLIPAALNIKWGLPVAEWLGVLAIIFYLKTFSLDFADYHFVVNDTGI